MGPAAPLRLRNVVPAAAVQPLEARRLMYVARDAAGWTVVTPTSADHRVYVSSSRGDDRNSGRSALVPVKTLAAGVALLRNGTGDQLLLARGDAWTTPFPTWTKSGATAADPMLVGTYGTGARPTILTGTASGLTADTRAAVDHLYLQGVVFDASGRDPTRGPVSAAAAATNPTGLELLGPAADVTVEDCSFAYFDDNVVLEKAVGAVSDVTLRRTTSAFAYGTTSRSEGLYADGVSGLTIDQDTFDHDGWNATVAGAGQTAYDHDIYTSSTVTGLTVTDSVIADAAFAGIMARGGGTLDGNLLLDDAAGIVVGDANGALSTVGGIRGQVEGNVILGDHGIGADPYGEGIEVGNTARGAGFTVSGNVIGGDTQDAGAAIALAYAGGTTNPAAAVGLNDLTVAGNDVYGWYYGITVSTFADGGTGVASLSGLAVRGNDFTTTGAAAIHRSPYRSADESWAGNAYVSLDDAAKPVKLNGTADTLAQWRSAVERTATAAAPAYVAPTRSAATYAATLGLPGSADALVAAAASLSDANWNLADTAAAVVAYVKAGFATQGTPTPSLTRLTGTTFGTAGSYADDGDTAADATDGNLATFFDAPQATGAAVGIDLGSARAVRQIAFAPRAGDAARMRGGVFQASNTADFSAGVVTVATITSTPKAGVLTTLAPSTTAAYRYWRYVGPARGHCNLAEFDLFG